VFVVTLVTGLVRRLQITYAVTTERLTIEQGLMTREVHEARLERVQNVNLRQSLLERALGVGTVDFDTAGSAAYDFSFTGVAEPRRLVRTVDRALRERLARPV
jgi:putative membrane protein